MRWTDLVLAAGVPVAESAVADLYADGGGQHVFGGHHVPATKFNCDLPPVLDPSADGLPAARDLFGDDEALLKQVERHSTLVKIPSVSYDDNGEPGKDPRWNVFYKLHAALAYLYPNVHLRMGRDVVNTFGLVFSIKGTNPSLGPIMLTAHQDVVPVADESTWKYPPFSAHFDGRWLWGRGASDDKNSLTALMSALDTLLANPAWVPQRSIIVALGFDEECSGRRGAGEIGKFLEQQWGKHSMAIILDEGGMGLDLLEGKTLYALPAVMEKGHVDIWLDLKINGGHSSTPFPHTGIGIMSEIVVKLESKPFGPKLIRDSPIHRHLVCQARYSPKASPNVTKLIEKGDLKTLAEELATIDRKTQYRLQTSQSVDYFIGGVKINAMPEKIRIGVNHRVAPQNSIPEVKGRILDLIKPIVNHYGLGVSAFKGEDNNPDDLGEFEPAYDVDYNGTLTLSSSQASQVAPISPSAGDIWDVLSGTIQHSFAFDDGKVVPVGELMTGNTDTRHYLHLSKHVYRWTPTRKGGTQNAHTVDEAIDMQAHMEALRFYYDLVRNFDAAEV
ncbi:peptidase family M20/M25/M40 [Apiospora marii]|uniref:peptidase family M20/M25/M40 n=1 Tax=Apiospora marii TaxID=335849 RepID=UPI00312F41D1